MESAQKRILTALSRFLTSFGIQHALDESYSNTGSVVMYRPNEMVGFGKIRYDFQSGTYKLSITLNGRQIPSQPNRPDYYDFYQDYTESTAFWQVLESELRKLSFDKVDASALQGM